MTRASTKRIADMVARVLSGTETEHDRTGEGMYAYARCLVGAWVTRAQKAEATVQCLRGVISPQADETGESFALSVRGVMALLMSQERAAAADLQARLAAYAELDVQHDSDCPAGSDLDGVVHECTCAMRVADPGRAERDRAHTEWIATQIAGAGRNCSRCGEKIERYGGLTKRDGDGFRCGRRACEERES